TTVDQICDPVRGYDYYGLVDRYISVTLRGYVAGMDHELDPITVALDLPCAPAMPGPRFTGNCDGGADVVQPDASISDVGTDATVDDNATEASPSASDASHASDGVARAAFPAVVDWTKKGVMLRRLHRYAFASSFVLWIAACGGDDNVPPTGGEKDAQPDHVDAAHVEAGPDGGSDAAS